ncbi:response regulator [Heliobacterium chlorum]|uniref:Stage 0 sporulation protein A homolog n=1 Tax=Heliobacterium chlorum TaxID=2698 RepID=A0ABR7SZ98_HELCL|nr:response regulator [Heliobacterium chlorum]MBC9783859.1 response regulator [Heliobacterium chlorum]
MCKLLVVDDESLERQAIRQILSVQCPSIDVIAEADNGEDACTMAFAVRPDIILMDIQMPGVDGLEAMKRIRQQLPSVKIVILTAFDEFRYAHEAIKWGAVEYLLKPIRPVDLVKVLSLVIGQVRVDKEKVRQEEMMQQQLTKAKPFVQMSFVTDLLSGKIETLEEIHERAAFLNFNFNAAVAMVIDVDRFSEMMSSKTELEKQFFKQQLLENITSLINEEAIIVPFEQDSFVVLLGWDASAVSSADNYSRRVAEKIRKRISQSMDVTVTIGIGHGYVNMAEVGKSYQEALSASRQSYFLGQNQVIHIDDVPHLKPNTVVFPFQGERALLEKVRCGERDDAYTALAALLENVFDKVPNEGSVKTYLLELLILLSRAAVEGGANLEQLSLANQAHIHRLMKCRTKLEISQCMRHTVERLFENMTINRSGTNQRLINKACEFITVNCQRNVTLEEVARFVHLSPYYFSRIFKQEKGCNFVDFLTEVRLEKAKKCLSDSDMNLVQIAGQVGYQDSSYFCRVFRKSTGMTPNQYRQQIKRSALNQG